jgi:hypothetical protein
MLRPIATGSSLVLLLLFAAATSGANPNAPVYACRGFEPPMHIASLPPAMGGGVIARVVSENRVLPFKAMLVNAEGIPVTNLVAAPRISLRFDEHANGPDAPVVDYAQLSGSGTSGDSFELTGSTWQFKLKAEVFNADERYMATMESGNTDEYTINPTCEGVFQVEY